MSSLNPKYENRNPKQKPKTTELNSGILMERFAGVELS